MKPEHIEALSFKIIDEEADNHNFSPDEWEIVRRMIHTSADFEYMKTIRFHPNAISAGISAIRGGKPVITDTNMAKAGIRQKDLKQFGGEVKCFIIDPRVNKIAEETKTTRAKAAVDIAAAEMKDGIYVVGNAPTALLRLIELIKGEKGLPALVIGLPVGFVNAAESKDALIKSKITSISNIGRKGGSNVAASVINALIKLAIKA